MYRNLPYRNLLLFILLCNCIYSTYSQTWTWLGTSATTNSYLASTSSRPGSRRGSAGWLFDNSLYIFGGEGFGDTQFVSGYLGDFWQFDLSATSWQLLGGNTNLDRSGSYGQKGVADPNNFPPSRTVGIISVCYSCKVILLLPKDAAYWTTSDALWMFGGLTYDTAADRLESLNDLWKYDVANDVWTWVSGTNDGDEPSRFSGSPQPGGRSSPGKFSQPLCL